MNDFRCFAKNLCLFKGKNNTKTLSVSDEKALNTVQENSFLDFLEL